MNKQNKRMYKGSTTLFLANIEIATELSVKGKHVNVGHTLQASVYIQ